MSKTVIHDFAEYKAQHKAKGNSVRLGMGNWLETIHDDAESQRSKPITDFNLRMAGWIPSILGFYVHPYYACSIKLCEFGCTTSTFATCQFMHELEEWRVK